MSPARLLRPASVLPAWVAARVALAAEPALGAGSQDALRPAGPQAAHILDLWWLTVGVCTAVFAAVLVAFVVALWRAPRSRADTPPDLSSLARPERGARRSVGWSVSVSAALLLALLAASVSTDRALAHLALRDALHVEVTAHQWWWEARYDDADASRTFKVANELHIPVGRPVIVTLKSDDVIHSLWIPNLAGKKDLIPGRTATLTLRADRAGTYRGQCAEFCGWQHAWMALLMVADPADAWDAWAARQRKPAATPDDAQRVRGQQVFLGTTCVMCHAIVGTEAGANRGPDLTHVGSRSTLAAGALANTPADLARWISDPQTTKPGTNMPAHAFAPADLQALVAYLESLQ